MATELVATYILMARDSEYLRSREKRVINQIGPTTKHA